MKTLNEIREERQANAAKIAELNEKTERAVNSWRTKEPAPEDFATLGAELAEKKKELDDLRNAFNKAVDAYNALTVNCIDHEKSA